MKKYLLALDGSELSGKAAEKVLGFAKEMPLKVNILVVASSKGIPNSWNDLNLVELIKGARMEEANKVASDGKKFFEENEIKVEVNVKLGDPAREICNEACSGGYDMVIMGACGLSGIKRSILGSVANEVVQCSSIPVLIVK